MLFKLICFKAVHHCTEMIHIISHLWQNSSLRRSWEQSLGLDKSKFFSDRMEQTLALRSLTPAPPSWCLKNLTPSTRGNPAPNQDHEPGGGEGGGAVTAQPRWLGKGQLLWRRIYTFVVMEKTITTEIASSPLHLMMRARLVSRAREPYLRPEISQSGDTGLHQ